MLFMWHCHAILPQPTLLKKSRQALALLEERGVEVEIVRYLEDGVVKEDLALLASLEGIVRKKEAGAEAMAALHSVDDIAALLVANPKVLERPVLVANGQAVIGRPPEDVLKLVEVSSRSLRSSNVHGHGIATAKAQRPMPDVASRRRMTPSMVIRHRVPLAPRGWPKLTAPPCKLNRSSGIPTSWATAHEAEAKASLCS